LDNPKVQMRSILIEHARRYPQWRLDDLYKLIHQAAMGTEHIMGDEAFLRDWLVHEFAHLGPGRDESLVDPISPDGRIVRVHLRPFMKLQLQEEPLLQAFIRTAEEVMPSRIQLAEYAASAIQVAEEGKLPFSSDRVTSYMEDKRARDYPAVHHSVRYKRLYKPAYRVVASDLLPEEIITAG
jgi:hypothetical protein